MNSRIVVGFCVDKEEDAQLLNFLNSKKNKSEFIRSVLYEKLNSNTSEQVNFEYSNSTNKILVEVLGQITMLTNRLLSLESPPLTSQVPISCFTNNDTSQHKQMLNEIPTDNQDVSLDSSEDISVNQDLSGAEEGVFGAVINSLHSL